MISGDLVYHITVPKESGSNVENNPLPLSGKESKLPVVILFGWMGSEDKHLAKYSSIYEDQMYITVRCIPPLSVLTVKFNKLPTLAQTFLDILYERSFDQHPIIFHILSNGGALFYQHVSLEMQKQNRTLLIKGIIFDSAPHHRTLRSTYHATAGLIGAPSLINVPLTFLATGMVAVYHDILWPLIKAATQLQGPKVVDVFLDDEPYTWPQLLIYSRTDRLCSWEDVEKFAQRREEKGVKVTKLCFDNSPHVQHLMTHPEIYISTVLRFMETCLKEKDSTDFRKVNEIRANGLAKL